MRWACSEESHSNGLEGLAMSDSGATERVAKQFDCLGCSEGQIMLHAVRPDPGYAARHVIAEWSCACGVKQRSTMKVSDGGVEAFTHERVYGFWVGR